MPTSKLLKSAGPLERLFAGSTSAPILDFLILAAQEGHAYSDSEIAQFSGASIKKTKTTISNLQKIGIIVELKSENEHQRVSGKRGQKKKYMLNQHSGIMMPLEKLVLALTDTELRKPLSSMKTVSINDASNQQTAHGVREVVTELIEKGLVRLDDQAKQD